MTALDTGPNQDQADTEPDPAPSRPVRADVGSVGAATRAYRRRQRRESRMTGHRLTRSGRPVRAALARLPFVLVNIGMLAGAIVGVLWLTTMKDEAGLRATASRQAQSSLQIQIESGSRDLASLGALPRIDAAARALGMVPAGDAAILQVTGNSAVVIGTPSPATAAQAAPPPAAAPAPSTTAAAATTPAPPASPSPGTPSAPTSPAPTSGPRTAARTSGASGHAGAPTPAAATSTAPATAAKASGPAPKTPAASASKTPAASAPATAAGAPPTSPAGATAPATTSKKAGR